MTQLTRMPLFVDSYKSYMKLQQRVPDQIIKLLNIYNVMNKKQPVAMGIQLVHTLQTVDLVGQFQAVSNTICINTEPDTFLVFFIEVHRATSFNW